MLSEVHGVVKTGKESSVYTATGWNPDGLGALLEQDPSTEHDGGESVATAGTSSTILPCTAATASFPPFSEASTGPSSMVAIKIFRTTLSEFSNRTDYVNGDYRFRKATSGRGLSHQNPRKVVKLWAEKEWANLTRMWRAGLPCPQPLRQ